MRKGQSLAENGPARLDPDQVGDALQPQQYRPLPRLPRHGRFQYRCGHQPHRGAGRLRNQGLLQRQGGAPVRRRHGGLGHRRHAGGRGHRRPAVLADPVRGHSVAELRPPAPAAHQRGDLRLRRQRPVRHQPARGAADLPRPADFRQARRIRVLGLAGDHRRRRHHPAAGHYPEQGIRRDGVADRHRDRGGVGGLRGAVLRHHRQAPGLAYLRGELVLRRLHHRHRAAAHRQQPGAAGRRGQVVHHLHRCGRRDGAVVVRPQRRGLPADRRLPRHDVLLRAQAGRAPDLLLPAVDRALLGPDLDLHVGRPAPPALHRPARLGAVGGHGVLADPAGPQLGRRDQRHHDPLGRVA